MRISIKNIGKVRKADIEIKGLTVIAGNNNTGKSTVGKALFAIFNSISRSDEQEYLERQKSIVLMIERNILYYANEIDTNALDDDFVHEVIDIIKNENSFENKYLAIENLLFKLVDEFASDNANFAITEDVKNAVKIASTQIVDNQSRTSEEILEKSMARNLNSEFYNQVTNINSEDSSEIKLSIKDLDTIVLIEDRFKLIQKGWNLRTQATYIDNPNVIDDFSLARFNYQMRRNHKNDLGTKFFSEILNEYILEEFSVDDNLDEINRIINSVCSGEIERQKSYYTYFEKGYKEPVKLANLSTGLKTFVIIKKLLENGNITPKGCLILDEPEIHLHPEWQLIFAELLVLLQIKFELHILLNTHSPYFLRAIQVYSAKHFVADQCKYYLAYSEGLDGYIDDVSNDIEKIFKSLAQPFQTLENEEWGN